MQSLRSEYTQMTETYKHWYNINKQISAYISAINVTFMLHNFKMQDTKQILTMSPPVEWKRSLGWPHIMWMKMDQNDMDSHKLVWIEAVNLAQNRSD